MTERRDAIRRAVRVDAEHLATGDRVAPWNDHDAAHREVVRTYAYDDHVLVVWADRTVTRHHRWTPFHRDVRI